MAQLLTLQNRVRRLTNTDDISYPADEINDSLTEWAHLFTTEILDSQDEWDFQEDIATIDLMANQREYPFPTDILKIKRIELKLDGSNWTPATIVDKSEIPYPISSESDIIKYFDNTTPYVALFGNSIYILSGLIIDVSGGIKIWYSKEVVGTNELGEDITFFSNDTDTPNIREAFQKGLVYGAAKDWFDKYEIQDKSAAMDAQLEKIIARMKQFYGSRIQDRRIIMKPASDLRYYE